jgi:glucosylceramidase
VSANQPSRSAVLTALQTSNSKNYWQLLRKMFDTTDPANAGLSYLRTTIGASDLSPFAYNYDPVAHDDLLLAFNLGKAADIFTVIRDVRLINPYVYSTRYVRGRN